MLVAFAIAALVIGATSTWGDELGPTISDDSATHGDVTSGQAEPLDSWELDDSDPEMQMYLNSILQGGHCDRPFRDFCETILIQFREGGERLASYALDQYEKAIEAEALEGTKFHNTRTMLLAAVQTRTRLAHEYVQKQIVQRSDERRYADATYSLFYSDNPDDLETAAWLLKNESERLHRYRAVVGIHFISWRSGEANEDAIAELLKIEADLREENGVRDQAFLALNAIEEKGLMGARVRPADLQAKLQATEQRRLEQIRRAIEASDNPEEIRKRLDPNNELRARE